eukprot:CAMPEP_0182445890 /NCGR_PEP_ID=MMETSP1172-20130603/3838_1 /TAXON_ID=708627 /ORGANISM="Timspurckia oligopyrenoides, Strain CCMP3278" /LENGTH=613 /DNA_ID=CAMNT_0024641725 /DNA_START=105 /DNA_END=1946 /DNA_ORIENTATION=-
MVHSGLLVVFVLICTVAFGSVLALPSLDPVSRQTAIIDDSSFDTGGWWMERIDQQGPIDRRPTNWENARSRCYPRLGLNTDVYIFSHGCDTGHVDFTAKTTGTVTITDALLNVITPAAGLRDLSSDGIGTFLASLVGGFYRGLAPSANIFCVQLTPDQGANTGSTWESLFSIQALADRAASSNRRIIALYALGTRIPVVIPEFQTVINNAINNGVIFIHSVNDISNTESTPGDACNYSPGSVSSQIRVAASYFGARSGNSLLDTFYSGSSTGATCIDYLSPGVQVEAADVSVPNGFVLKDGNKVAGAMLAGSAALVSSYYAQSLFLSASAHNTYKSALAAQGQGTLVADSTGATHPIGYFNCGQNPPPNPPEVTELPTLTPTPLPTGTPTAIPTPASTPTPTPTPTPVPTINPNYAADCATAQADCSFGFFVSGSIYNVPTALPLANCTGGCSGAFSDDFISNEIGQRLQFDPLLSVPDDGCATGDGLDIGTVQLDWPPGSITGQVEVLDFFGTFNWLSVDTLVPAAAGNYFYSDYLTGDGTCDGDINNVPDLDPADNINRNDIFQRLSNVGTGGEFAGRCFRVWIRAANSNGFNFGTFTDKSNGNCFVFLAE